MTIDQKYAQLGGPTGFLGKPVTAETVCPDQTGHFRHFEHGSIYWNPATDAHEVHGAIRDRWSSLGWEESWLGYPTSDEEPEAGGGRISFFQNGFIDWSPANGAVDRAHLQFQAYFGKTADQHQAAFNTLQPTGWRMTALTVYGDSPLYGAVWVKQDGPPWVAIHNATAAEFQAFVTKWDQQNFRFTLVAATGSGSNPTFAGVMEQTSGPISISRFGLTPDQFKAWCAWAAQNNFILTTAALYGDSGNPCIVAAWNLNTDNTPWNADSLLKSLSDTQTIFNAQVGHESRLYEMIPSPYNSWLALYRGDAVGPGQAFTSLTPPQFQSTFNQQVAQGFFPSSFHAAGEDDSDAVFSAIFTKRETPLPKRWVATGTPVPSLQLFDEQMQGYMQRYDIRNASLAIAKGSKLVYARAFTWAEPGYPIAQPTTSFRVGSCSKCLTSILIWQLLQEGANTLQLSDLVETRLALTPPPGQAVQNTDFSKYQISHMLTHQSGIAKDFAWADPAVVQLFGQQLPAKSKWQIASWLMTQPREFPVGSQADYANSGFLVLAAVVEKLRNTEWFNVFRECVMKPLGLTRSAVSGSLLSQRAPGEALYHDPSGLGLVSSMMTPDQPLVHSAYGNPNLSVGEAVGGMAMVPAEYCKIMAALDRPDNPILHPDMVGQMLSYPNQMAKNYGWGNGWGGHFTSQGVQAWGLEGALFNIHAWIDKRMDGFSLCVAFNTGQYPFASLPPFDDLIDMAPDWPTNDLFPSLGIPAF